MSLGPLAPLPLLTIIIKEELKTKEASPHRRGWVLPVQSQENEGSRDAGRGTRGSHSSSREVTPSMSLEEVELQAADCPPPATQSPMVSLEAMSDVTNASSHRWLNRGQMTNTGILSITKAGNSAKTCPTSSRSNPISFKEYVKCQQQKNN